MCGVSGSGIWFGFVFLIALPERGARDRERSQHPGSQDDERRGGGGHRPHRRRREGARDGTVDRVGVASATKTLPSTDYKSSGRTEIVVEIRGPTTSRLLQVQPGGRGSPAAGATIRGLGAFSR